MSRRAAFRAIVLAAAWIPAAAFAQTVHKFPDHGFKISAPSGWTLIPPRPGEQWILARFMSDREYSHRDAKNAVVATHRPWLRVLGFPKRDSPIDVHVLGNPESRTTFVTYPYRDYADYLKRHDHGGGYYVANTEEITVGGIAVTRQEVKIEKLAMAPRRLLACIYHLPDRDLAVEAEILETQVGAMSEEIGRALKSLVITGEAKKAESSPSRPNVPLVADNPKDFAKMRDERRRAWRDRALADVQKTLPKGWSMRKTKYFLVLTHAGSGYTDLLVWQANEVREWLDDNLKGVGEGEVTRSIIRVCASADEARAYVSGSGDSYVADTGEVVCAERSGSILDDFSQIARALLNQYLADRNPALEGALPYWLNVGLSAHVDSARISKKQSGLIFPIPVGSLRTCLRMIQENRFIPVDQLVRTEPDTTGNDQKAWDRAGDFCAESELFVRYLLLGPGKSGRTKGLVQRYMQGAVQQLEEMDVDLWKKMTDSRPSKAPMTEEEEEAEFKRRRAEGKEFGKKHRQERLKLLDELTGIVVKDWKPEDWAKLNKSFESWVKNSLR